MAITVNKAEFLVLNLNETFETSPKLDDVSSSKRHQLQCSESSVSHTYNTFNAEDHIGGYCLFEDSSSIVKRTELEQTGDITAQKTPPLQNQTTDSDLARNITDNPDVPDNPELNIVILDPMTAAAYDPKPKKEVRYCMFG